MSEPASKSETVITASAVATHPKGVRLDEAGHPVLDEHGQPIYDDEAEEAGR